DIDKAKQLLVDQETNDIKKKLKAEFDSATVIIDSSFTASSSDSQTSPAVGAEATTGKAKLTRETTYTITGVSKTELNNYLDESLKKNITNTSQQRIYDNGQNTVKLADFKSVDTKTSSVSLTATGKIGPKINDENIKDQVKGKRTGEVIGDLRAIDGVSDVSVNLSPFWVSGIPNDIKKISVEFKLIKND
ncbi:MAG: hypothetical protein WAW80_03810, partial [Candidatus Saccharimonadales bacterium]